jgi:hypothetical protein
MVTADVGRVPIVDRDTQHLLGLVSRKDLLRIRAAARTSESSRIAFFGPRRPAKQNDGASASGTGRAR